MKSELGSQNNNSVNNTTTIEQSRALRRSSLPCKADGSYFSGRVAGRSDARKDFSSS